MKIKVLVIILLLFVVLAIVLVVYTPREYEREFRGTFVRNDSIGYLHQAQEESGTGKPG
jgi:hypothetical protein